MVQKSGVPISDERIAVAYSISKSLIKYELDEFEKYNQMTIGEFYEFLGRVADFLYYQEDASLINKIEKLLKYFLPICGEKVRKYRGDIDIDTESDYEDDIIFELNR